MSRDGGEALGVPKLACAPGVRLIRQSLTASENGIDETFQDIPHLIFWI
jgi:hypothetical protein